MSLHAMSILRGRRTSLFRWIAVATVVIMALFAINVQMTFAQIADPPPPANANPKTALTAEDTPVTINTGIQADPRYQVVIVSPGPAHGTIVPGGVFPNNFIITYTPGANQTIGVSFSYQICVVIGTPACGQSALVTVSITPVNDGPQAGADNASVKFGQSVLINVLANDNGGVNEADAAFLVPGGVSVPAPDGTAVIEGNQIRYTAPAAPVPCTAPSNATFSYLVQDSSGLQSAGTVTVVRTCPGTPTLKLGEPYAFTNHTFKIDVILDSADVDVAAVDFFLGYDACLTDVDNPSNSMVADDVTNMPPAPNFLSQVQDQPFPGTLHFVSAGVVPNAILAGPTSPTRTIATMQFKALSVCTTAFTFGTSGFTSTGGTPIAGATLPKTVTLTDANSKPTNITLSNNKVTENSPFNTFIGQFSATDPDVGDTFTYAFALPFGDNAGKFRIRPLIFNNDELAVQNLNGVAPGIYNITVAATDSYGSTFTKDFAIEVIDVNLYAPIANNDGVYNVLGRTEIAFRSMPANGIDLVANDIDPDVGNCNNCSIQSVTNGSKGLVTNLGTKVVYIPTDPKFFGPLANDTFTYILTDNDLAGARTDDATVTVNVQQDAAPGDCNKSNVIEAGDLTATGLEIFDGDGNSWYNIYQGTYKNFSPYGCNSNQDAVVDAGDISCTAQKIFNNAFVCGIVMASSSTSANLAVESVSAAPGTTVQVPVVLSTAGNSVAAAAFAIDFNSDELSFDATDADNNGVADAVSLNVPAGLLATASYNAAESRVEIVVTGLMPPFPLLADGAVATVSLTVKDGVTVSESTVTLANSSLGSDEGQSVPLEVSNGSIEIVSQPASRILLPLIRMQ